MGKFTRREEIYSRGKSGVFGVRWALKKMAMESMGIGGKGRGSS